MTDDLDNSEYRLAFCDSLITCLLRGGFSIEHVLKVLYIIYNKYSDDYTKEQVEEDVLIHHEMLTVSGGYKLRRNVQQEIENLIDFRGNGSVTLAEIYNDLKLISPEEKTACRMAINRIVSKGVIEKVDGGKTGTYRKILSSADETKFIKGPRNHFPIKLPFGLNKLCYIHPKSIIILAGSKSAGKTATLLHTALENQNKLPVIYLNSDMGDEEYTDRITKMGCLCEEDICFKIYSRSKDFHDLITPEKKIFIVDFLEIHENFYEIGKPIKAIWEKLKEGVAIIAIQMKSGGDTARGGDFTKEKARLYIAMDFLPDEKCSVIKIIDAKAPAPEYPDGVQGWKRKVKIINGSRFEYLNNWNFYDEEKKTPIRREF